MVSYIRHSEAVFINSVDENAEGSDDFRSCFLKFTLSFLTIYTTFIISKFIKYVLRPLRYSILIALLKRRLVGWHRNDGRIALYRSLSRVAVSFCLRM